MNKKNVRRVLSAIIIGMVLGLILYLPAYCESKNYKLEILEFGLLSEDKAYISYEATNNTNEDVFLRLYLTVEKEDEVLSSLIAYCPIKANGSRKMTMIMERRKFASSFVGSKAKIKIMKVDRD